MKPKNILLKDQRELSISEAYPKPPKKQSPNCSESLNTTCSYCGMMIQTNDTFEGADCTISYCELDYWRGTRNWNRLFHKEDRRAVYPGWKKVLQELMSNARKTRIKKVAL